MSDIPSQEALQMKVEIQGKASDEQTNITNRQKLKRITFSSVKNSRIFLLAQQYVIPVFVIFIIIAMITFIFLLQRDRSYGDKDIMERAKTKKVKVVLEEHAIQAEEEVQKGHEEGEADIHDLLKQEEQNGRVLSEQDDASQAILFENANYIVKANRLYDHENFETALSYYEKGLDKTMPFLNEDFVIFRLGDCYLKLKRYEDAIKTFRTLNNDYLESPFQLQCKLKMGECYAGLGEFRKARNTLFSVIAQEGKCKTEDDKSVVVDSYFKIAEYYMEEAKKLCRATTTVGTSSLSYQHATN